MPTSDMAWIDRPEEPGFYLFYGRWPRPGPHAPPIALRVAEVASYPTGLWASTTGRLPDQSVEPDAPVHGRWCRVEPPMLPELGDDF